ncbi:MAG TPA: methionyl-tRNA formyltransferase [Ottowia sp.]|uniref:methionyl-tRNA formyltransferase n=1 Tax=Ottowia sp. TaxID=1898956 RepID=UPI002D0D8D14|nr:methionyl-tRNA formyltransferase [Ottowia sp.]HMN21804.1 methionyl-tRNA formyltransferase [Ottowia sp.]
MSLRVAFAGTPEFAARALQAILEAGFAVPLVLTQPDRPAGRGLKLQTSPVKQLARAHGLPVVQPRSLRLDGRYPQDAEAARAALQAADADVLVVAAYGLILPRWVLDAMSAARPPGGAQAPSGGSATGAAVERGGEMSAARPPGGAQAPSGGSATGAAVERGGLGLGALNIHASLLPRWRGAAPIQRAIEAGDAETGITIMQMDEGLDTGAMLLQARCPIGAQATSATLHDELAALGARLIVEALRRAAQGSLRAVPQPATGATYAHKIDKAEAAIDWRLPAATIERRIRAFDPFPGASTSLEGVPLKVWRASVDAQALPAGALPGDVLAVDDDGIGVACGEGVLRLAELQRAGGRRLPARAFLAGCPVAPGMRLGTGQGDVP